MERRLNAESNLHLRFRTVIGHLKSVERMVLEDEVPYLDVLHQITAVQGALMGIRRTILAEHLQSRLETAVTESRSSSFVEDVMAAGFGRSCPPRT